jgi:hypothetical protein
MDHQHVLSKLGDIFANVLGEDFVNQGLVAHVSAARFLAELIEHARIDTDGDQLTRFVTERGSTDTSHRLELHRRRLGDVRKVN